MTIRRNALRLGALAVLGLLGRGEARAADALVIESDGATIFAKRISFGKRVAELLTLHSPNYAIGVQDSTSYSRTERNFAWYKGGQHTNKELEPGEGGVRMMSLTSGDLEVVGVVKARSLETTTGLSLDQVQNRVGTVQNVFQSALSMVVPIGTIMAFAAGWADKTAATELDKQGWLLCNGATVKKDDYNDLFKVIGTNHGSPGPGYFAVPNLQGSPTLNMGKNFSWIIKAKRVAAVTA